MQETPALVVRERAEARETVAESRNARSCEPESLQDVEPRNFVPRLLPLCALIFLRRKIDKRGRRPVKLLL
jgi:hypothetical protein